MISGQWSVVGRVGSYVMVRGMAILCFLVLLFGGVVQGEETSLPQRLTDDGLFKQRPIWSPDGKWLVFARHRGDTIFLFLRSADGKTEKRITGRTDPEYDACWAPDSKRLAFAFDKVSPGQGDIDVYTIGIDGEKLSPVIVSDGLSHEEYPSWSPDGKRIAFSSTRHNNKEIYTILPNGKEMKRLTADPALDAHPAWSPDGKRIAFATARWGDLELAVIDIESQSLTRLTHSRGLDDYPAWSPDGRQIAFTSNRAGNLEIFVIDANGNNPRNATQNPALDNFPSWSPDGQLTFVSNRHGGFDIYMQPISK